MKTLFHKPTAEQLRHRERDEAERGLLEATRARDYHESLIGFYKTRLKDLDSALVVKAPVSLKKVAS